jgi:hypothetical protein
MDTTMPVGETGIPSVEPTPSGINYRGKGMLAVIGNELVVSLFLLLVFLF